MVQMDLRWIDDERGGLVERVVTSGSSGGSGATGVNLVNSIGGYVSGGGGTYTVTSGSTTIQYYDPLTAVLKRIEILEKALLAAEVRNLIFERRIREIEERMGEWQ